MKIMNARTASDVKEMVKTIAARVPTVNAGKNVARNVHVPKPVVINQKATAGTATDVTIAAGTGIAMTASAV